MNGLKLFSFVSMNTLIAIGVVVLTCLIRTGLGIDCYRCNSTSLDCLEKFMYPNPLRAENCGDVFEARYCIKTTGIYQGVLGTRRFCSEKDMGNYCDFIHHEHDKREYKGCVYTCNSDGCNDAHPRSPTALNIVLLIATIVIISSFFSIT